MAPKTAKPVMVRFYHFGKTEALEDEPRGVG